MSEAIISVALNKPPYEATRLASKANLLVAFRLCGYVRCATEYHFATHSPTWGWHGYRWNEQYGVPSQILPDTQDTVWVSTVRYRLMYLKIRQNSEVAVINTDVEVRGLFHADEQGILVKTRDSKISLLRFGEDDGQLCKIDLFYSSHPSWSRFLPDGAIVIYNSGRLIVLSAKGNILHEERGAHCHNCPRLSSVRMTTIYTTPMIHGRDGTDIPENAGILAWDPIENIFYADIPHTTSIQRISTGQIPTINIPGIWGQDICQRCEI